MQQVNGVGNLGKADICFEDAMNAVSDHLIVHCCMYCEHTIYNICRKDVH